MSAEIRRQTSRPKRPGGPVASGKRSAHSARSAPPRNLDAAGVCSNLEREDILLSTHRGHGHTLAKGADPLAMMRELFGREGGNCGGKGGSMHIADFSVGMLGANGVVAANIVIAAGAAPAIKINRGEKGGWC